MLCRDHQRQDKIPQGRRDRWYDKKEDHDRAMQRKDTIIRFGIHEVLAGIQQLRAKHDRQRPCEEKEEHDRRKIHDPDPLVIERKQPALPALRTVQVMRLRNDIFHSITNPRLFQRLYVGDQGVDLTVFQDPLIGRHYRIIPVDDMRARVEDRLAYVIFIRNKPLAIGHRLLAAKQPQETRTNQLLSIQRMAGDTGF